MPRMPRGPYKKRGTGRMPESLNYVNEISTVVNTSTHTIYRDFQIDIKDELPSSSSRNIAESHPTFLVTTPEVETSTSTEIDRPLCWTEYQMEYYQKQNKWLSVKDGKLGCNYCLEVSKLKSGKVSVSSKWTNFKISYYGVTRLQQHASLRKKMFEHKKSIAHGLCHKIIEKQQTKLETPTYAPSIPNAMCVIPENSHSPIRIFNSFTPEAMESNDDSYRNVMQNNELIVFPLQAHIKEEPQDSYEENTEENASQYSSENQCFQDILPIPADIIDRNLQNQDDQLSNIPCENIEKKINKEDMIKIMRIIYKTIKQNHHLRNTSNEFTLQSLNGCDLGNLTEQDCENVCSHIANEMRKKLIQQMRDNKSKFSLILEENTAINEKTILILHLRTFFYNDDDPIDIFLDIITLRSTNSRDIVTSLLDYLKQWDLDIGNNLVCIGIDGTSPNIGIHSDVPAVFCELYPNIILWNCQNNKLECSVGDYFVNNFKSNSFKNFIEKLYNLYSKSFKVQMEFSTWFPELKDKLSQVGKINSVRSIASSFQTVKVIWTYYIQLNKYFCEDSSDILRDPEDVLLCRELKMQLNSQMFVKNLGILYDALQELNELSIEISSGSLVDAQRSISRQMSVFESMVYTPGPMFRTAQDQIANSKFGDVILHKSMQYDFEIDRHSFFNHLKESLNARLISKDSIHHETPSNENIFIENIKIFQPKYWPSIWSATYGENEINSLCQRYQFESRPIIRSFREFKETNGKIINDNLKSLLKIIKTFPVSSMHCEKVYQQMDSILKMHGNIPANMFSDILFIQLNGPPLNWFNVDDYVESWLEEDKELLVKDVKMEEEEENYLIWKLL